METGDRFFDRPILNPPYEYPARHWEVDERGRPTHRILGRRRNVSFVMAVPGPKKDKDAQQGLDFDEEARRRATDDGQYRLAQTIDRARDAVDRWRASTDLGDWRVTPETARLLRRWRHRAFSHFRGEDAKDRKATMDIFWVPGVNALGTFERWAFAEYTDMYEIESGFDERIEGFLSPAHGIAATISPVEPSAAPLHG